jgi:hypothetical protein
VYIVLIKAFYLAALVNVIFAIWLLLLFVESLGDNGYCNHGGGGEGFAYL